MFDRLYVYSREPAPAVLLEMCFCEVPEGSVFWRKEGDRLICHRKTGEGTAHNILSLDDCKISSDELVVAYSKKPNYAPQT